MGVGPALLGGQKILEPKGNAGKGADGFPGRQPLLQDSGSGLGLLETGIDEGIDAGVAGLDPFFKEADYLRGRELALPHRAAQLRRGKLFQLMDGASHDSVPRGAVAQTVLPAHVPALPVLQRPITDGREERLRQQLQHRSGGRSAQTLENGPADGQRPGDQRENHEGQKDEKEIIHHLRQEGGAKAAGRIGSCAVGIPAEAAADADVGIVIGQSREHVGNGAGQQNGPLAAHQAVQGGMIPDPPDQRAAQGHNQIHRDRQQREQIGCRRAEVLDHDIQQ